MRGAPATGVTAKRASAAAASAAHRVTRAEPRGQPLDGRKLVRAQLPVDERRGHQLVDQRPAARLVEGGDDGLGLVEALHGEDLLPLGFTEVEPGHGTLEKGLLRRSHDAVGAEHAGEEEAASRRGRPWEGS